MGKKLLRAVSLSALMMFATETSYGNIGVNYNDYGFCLLCTLLDCPNETPIEVIATSKDPSNTYKAKVSKKWDTGFCYAPNATIIDMLTEWKSWGHEVLKYSISIKYPSGKVVSCGDIRRDWTTNVVTITYHKDGNCSLSQ